MNKKTIKNKKTPTFIFAYGSLVNNASRKRTLKKHVKAYPAIISKRFGYKKAFNTIATINENEIVMGIEKNNKYSTHIRGAIFPVNKEQKKSLQKREFVYNPIKIPKKYINTNITLPDNAKVLTFKPKKTFKRFSKTKKIHVTYANRIQSGMSKMFGNKTIY